MLKVIKNRLGAGLLEMIVVVAIFSVTILAATDIFKWVIEGQRNALAAQNIQENMRYAFETMSKEIRMAQERSGCGPTDLNKVYDTSVSNTRLHFRNQDDDCVTYYLDSNTLMVTRAGNSAAVTPNEIKVSNLQFIVIDDLDGAVHSVQPRVTMAMEVEAVGKVMHKQKIRLEFTISSRYYE